MSCTYWSGPCQCAAECSKLGCRDVRGAAIGAPAKIKAGDPNFPYELVGTPAEPLPPHSLRSLVERLGRRILAKHGGTGDPWRDHWNLTENDSLLHKEALDALSQSGAQAPGAADGELAP